MSFEKFEKSDALKKAEKEDAELAAKLAGKKEIEPFPGPATVNSEIALEYSDELGEAVRKEGELIEFPAKKKPSEVEEPEKKKAA
jgi:hypothetical protein